MPKIHLPSGVRKMIRDPDISDAITPNEDRPVIGEATIIFSGYRVNHGIPDQYFEEEAEGRETD